MSGLRIEIRIAEPSVDGPMAYAEIGQATRIIGSDREVTRQVNHEVVDAAVPAQRCRWIKIGESPPLVADAARSRNGQAANRIRQSAVDRSAIVARRAGQADGQLPSKHRGRKHVAGSHSRLH